MLLDFNLHESTHRKNWSNTEASSTVWRLFRSKMIKGVREKNRYEAIRETCAAKSVTIAFLSSKEDIHCFTVISLHMY